jgi:hypothetical protein
VHGFGLGWRELESSPFAPAFQSVQRYLQLPLERFLAASSQVDGKIIHVERTVYEGRQVFVDVIDCHQEASAA